MKNEHENINQVVGFIDGFIGSVMDLAGSVVGILALGTIPMLILWGILWVLNEIGIV